MIRIISRLDVKSGHLIKGIHLEGLKKLGDPRDFALKYYNEGVDEILFVDPVASLYGRNQVLDVVSRICEDIFVPITVAGGIRSVEDAQKVFLSGADKVAVNTEATKRPQLLRDLAKNFGSQSVVLSVEAKKIGNQSWIAYTDNGREVTDLEVVKWAKEAVTLGVGEILLTSVDQEGTLAGLDLELISAVAQAVDVPIVVSGGFRNLNDLKAISAIKNVSGIAIAAALHYGKIDIKALKLQALQAGIEVRI